MSIYVCRHHQYDFSLKVKGPKVMVPCELCGTRHDNWFPQECRLTDQIVRCITGHRPPEGTILKPEKQEQDK